MVVLSVATSIIATAGSILHSNPDRLQEVRALAQGRGRKRGCSRNCVSRVHRLVGVGWVLYGSQDHGYLGQSVQVSMRCPGGVKGEWVGQWVVRTNRVQGSGKKGGNSRGGVAKVIRGGVSKVNPLKDRGVFRNEQHLVRRRLNRGLCTKENEHIIV